MSNDNLPAENAGPVDDATKTSAELVDDIADLLEDPSEDLPEDDKAQAKAGETDEGDEPEIEIDPEDVANEDDAADEDGSEAEIKGGRFAPDSAKVTLEDGTVITVAELKRNNLFQRDYTKKTTELSAEREQINARKSEVDQQAQSLAQLAERLTVFSQTYLPKPPEPFQGTPDTDPLGYMRYMQQREQYESAVAAFNGIADGRTQLTAAQQAEQDDRDKQALAAEVEMLRQSDKFFADPGKVNAFFAEAVEKGGKYWGLTREDVEGLRSHKAIRILREAMLYRRAVEKSGSTQKQVEAKPVMVKGGKRADPKARVSSEKTARSERLRRDGSFQSGVAALMDLDL